METILKAGANIDAKNIFDETPLMSALGRAREDVAAFLIANGANVNAKNKFGSTPLEYALVIQSTQAIRSLLDKGADPTVMTSLDPNR